MGAVTSTRRSARTAFRSRTTRSAPAAKAARACSARRAMHLALGAVRPEERGVSPSPGADVAGVSPSPGADVAGVSPVPAQMWAVVPVDCRARWSSGKCSRRTLRWFTSGSSTTESERSAARCAACNMRRAPYNTEDANRQVARFSTRCPYMNALRRAVVSVKIVALLRGVCDAVAPEATATVCADDAAASARVERFGYGCKGWLQQCFACRWAPRRSPLVSRQTAVSSA
jgi:hypothetical protein